MLQTFITLLPFSFAVLQLFAYMVRRDKTDTQRLIMWLNVSVIVYLFSDALLVHPALTDFRMFLIVDSLVHFIVPMIPLVIFLVLYSFRHPASDYRKFYPLAFIATFYGTACLTVTLLAGFDNVAGFLQSYYEHRTFVAEYDTTAFRMYLMLNVYFYYILCAVETLFVLGYIIYYLRRKRFGLASLWRFVMKGDEATPLIILCWCTMLFCLLVFIRMGVGRFYWVEHQNVSAIVSAFFAFDVYAFFSIGMVSHMYEGTLREMLHPLMLAAGSEDDGSPLGSLGGDEQSPDEERLAEELVDLMENRQLFRNPNLTIEDVALRLNTERAVVVRIIDRHMGSSFREYINKLRVYYAQRYMMLHPFDTQEKVALESGFPDAASFNKKFRQVENMTPREWTNQKKRTKQHTR